jgi:hypothetical protein
MRGIFWFGEGRGLFTSFMITFRGGRQTSKSAHFVLPFFLFTNHEANFWFVQIKKRRNAADFLVCGETGIRTQGTLLAYTHFPGVLLRPLGHLSGKNNEMVK